MFYALRAALKVFVTNQTYSRKQWSAMRSPLRLIKLASLIHRYIYQCSRGRIGKRLGKVPFLILTTTGSRSGKERHVPLAAIPYGNDYILVASFGGSPTQPAWLNNLRKNPIVHIRFGSSVKQAMASIIETTDNRYRHMWEKAIETYAGFDKYKKATSRKIPIVLISQE